MTTIRIVLFAILLLGMIGSGAELMLLSHTEDLRQWIPLILLGTWLIGFRHGMGFIPARSASEFCRRSFIGYHFERLCGNVLSLSGQRRIQIGNQPFASGWALFCEAIRAKAPPLLAPGTMVQLGLLGWFTPTAIRRSTGRRIKENDMPGTKFIGAVLTISRWLSSHLPDIATAKWANSQDSLIQISPARRSF